MHKFILAENPQAPQTGGLWIIHLPEPICIIECVIEGEKIHSKKAIFKKEFQYIGYDGIENWQLRIYHYYTTDFDERKRAKELCEKMLNDAWHWYESYLLWEDENIYNEKN